MAALQAVHRINFTSAPTMLGPGWEGGQNSDLVYWVYGSSCFRASWASQPMRCLFSLICGHNRYCFVMNIMYSSTATCLNNRTWCKTTYGHPPINVRCSTTRRIFKTRSASFCCYVYDGSLWILQNTNGGSWISDLYVVVLAVWLLLCCCCCCHAPLSLIISTIAVTYNKADM